MQAKKRTAFQRNIHFPEFLFDLGLSGHREERFLIKVESEDQQVEYTPMLRHIKGCGFYFPFSVPPDGITLLHEIVRHALRQKGRDFTMPCFCWHSHLDYTFLSRRMQIQNLEELKTSWLKC
ncbi:MAG: hypothetical protein R2751_09700 [Bacteroidales bacterium]